MIRKYFVKQQEVLDDLQLELESIEQQMEVMKEENPDDNDMLSEAKSDTGNITKEIIRQRINVIKEDSEFTDELKILLGYKKLLDEKKKFVDQIKTINTELDKNLLKKYYDLTESEIKELVINDKWLDTINNSINDEMGQISHKLATRINELADRYETPLPDLTKEIQRLSKKVDNHLEQMGFKW